MKNFFIKNWQHFAVVIVFLIITIFYFAPEFNGYNLKQHDVEQYLGMSQETKMFREKTGQEPLWTNSMFGGMPTTQISTLYTGNIFQKMIISFLGFVGVPSGIFLMHLLGFYILALCLRMKPLIGFIGALAFAFASYEIVILQAGHNSKAMTVALMAPVVGAFILAYRHNWKWGAILSALFMSFELASNHLQVTYYLAFLLLGLGIFELFKVLKTKDFKKFTVSSAAILGAYGLAIFINYGNISMTNDYAKNTIRGGNDIDIKPDGSPAVANTKGLDKDYITNWSYGIGESFTLVSPYVKGSASVLLADTKFRDQIENSDRSPSEIKTIMEAQYALYWGDQPMTSGPVYIGVIMIFLVLLGMVYIKDNSKWVYLSVAVLALMLSWGKNFMGLTDFFIDFIPGYNKFRTVTIIMILIELCIPIIAMLLLQKLYEERETIKETKKKFLIVSGVFFVFLLAVKIVGLGDNYTTAQELEQINSMPEAMRQQVLTMDPQMMAQNYGVDVTNKEQFDAFIDAQIEGRTEGYNLLKTARMDIFNASMNRSLLFAFFAIAIFALYFYTSINTYVIYGAVAVLIMVDLIPVANNYLSSETLDNGDYKHWMPEADAKYPLSPSTADLQILEIESANPSIKKAIMNGDRDGKRKADELGYSGSEKRKVIDSYRFSALNFATNYRVFDYNNPWGSSRTSYFHKSLGGYHGAKLRNIQNLFDFQLAQSNNKVLDMLNVKYFIQGENLVPNRTAMGTAWFVRSVETKESPNDEIRALGNEFKITNVGSGKFFVNGVEQKEATVYGAETIQYLMAGKDTLKVPLSNGLSEGMEALFVVDANGTTNLVPNTTLLADSLNSFVKLAQIKVMNEFKVREEVVILNDEAKKLKRRSFTGEGSIKMDSYAPNRIVYSSSSSKEQLAIFSEIYYNDGWKAFVDGKESDILKVNYLLRAIELPAGNHKIEFKFELPQYTKSNNYAIFGSVLLFAMLGGLIFFDLKKKLIIR
ncbi:MAG: YfhO family protein [Crocinitomicaceae bacterium]|nr:YfhO family protein [Crocinitomicaceae bacterium]